MNKRSRFLAEPLESRVMFATTPFVAHVNFQPASAPVPAGYIVDSGAKYGVRASGLSYGWNANNNAVYDRNSALSPDQRYDTVALLQRSTPLSWEIAVPNGDYRVHLVAGDAVDNTANEKLLAENVLVINGVTNASTHWIEATKTVTVSDGRLTIKTAAGATAARIAFVDIEQQLQADPLVAKLTHAIDFARQQFKRTLADLSAASTTNTPRVTNADGTWQLVDYKDWTSGFFPASLWKTYAQTGDAYWKTQATPLTLPLAQGKSMPSNNGFRIYNTFKPLYDATGNASYRQTILDATTTRFAQWNAKVGALKTPGHSSNSGNAAANFGINVDQLPSLEMLFWAASQTGNQTWYNQAVQHARTAAKYLVRADGSTFHWGFFNSTSGAFIGGETWQGYSNSSTWSRGQAWAMLGFSNIYRDTKLPEFLATAQKVADWFIAHLPADGIPFWDFNDPKIPNTWRDTSAAAIAASALMDLSKLATDPTASKRYHDAAGKILNALASAPYFAEGTSSHGVLLHGAWFVPPPSYSSDATTSWGDYYFTDAAGKYLFG